MPSFKLSIAFAVLLFASLGCGKKDSAAPTTKESKPADPTGTPTLPTTATNTGDSGAEALKAATDFLKAVQEGKATSASLTPGFKRVIAPPELEADKAPGYSESGVQAWLTAAKAVANADGLKVDLATPDYAVLSTPVDKPVRAFVRMVKAGTGWAVDHARLNAKSKADIAFVGNTPAAALATIFFVEAALAGNKAELETLLSKTAKGKIAPPLFEEDKAAGYSRIGLNSALGALFPEGTTFVGLTQEQAGMKALVTLASGDKNRSWELKLAPGAGPGEFLIDDLQQK